MTLGGCILQSLLWKEPLRLESATLQRDAREFLHVFSTWVALFGDIAKSSGECSKERQFNIPFFKGGGGKVSIHCMDNRLDLKEAVRISQCKRQNIVLEL